MLEKVVLDKVHKVVLVLMHQTLAVNAPDVTDLGSGSLFVPDLESGPLVVPDLIFVKNPNMLNKRKREIMPGREEEEKCHFWQALPVQDTQNEQDLTFYKCQN